MPALSFASTRFGAGEGVAMLPYFLTRQEIFIASADEVSKHRLKGGMSLAFTTNVFFDVYYLRQEDSTLIAATNSGGLNLKCWF